MIVFMGSRDTGNKELSLPLFLNSASVTTPDLVPIVLLPSVAIVEASIGAGSSVELNAEMALLLV